MLGAGLPISTKGPWLVCLHTMQQHLSLIVGLPTWQLCLQGPPEAADECCAVGRHKATLLGPRRMGAKDGELYTGHQLPALSICRLQRRTKTFGEWCWCRATERLPLLEQQPAKGPWQSGSQQQHGTGPA